MLNLSTRWHTFTYLFNSSEVFHGHSFITIGSHCELCDISAKFSLDLPWKKKITECPERCIWNTILQVVLFLKGSKNIYEWFVFVKWSVCQQIYFNTVLHKKSITSLAFGWHKMNSKTFKYHFSAFRRNVIVPVLFSGSSIENTFHIFSMETLCPGGFLEIRNTLKTEEKVGDLF